MQYNARGSEGVSANSWKFCRRSKLRNTFAGVQVCSIRVYSLYDLYEGFAVVHVLSEDGRSLTTVQKSTAFVGTFNIDCDRLQTSI